MRDLVERLDHFLESRELPGDFESLTADASTREYFRIQWHGNSAIACVYPEPFRDAVEGYVDVTRLFVVNELPVASIYEADVDAGIVVQEDLGDTVLREVMLAADPTRRRRLLDEAITLIARIQVATESAREMNSVASRLRFDREKLLWELDFFKKHYFETYRRSGLSQADDESLTAEFDELASELETYAAVLCHRDFHAANLMLDPLGRMRIIDHQDARIGSATYDLVSLLLDRINEPPSREWLAEKRKYFLEVRRKFGMPKLDEDEFAYEFRLQTIQRCLKAAGTFSFQSVNRGKTHFLPFIGPMFRISVRAAESLGRFPAIHDILDRELHRSNP